MTMKTTVLACACAVFAVSTWAHAQVKVEFEPTQVVATGLTPGAGVAWLAAARERPQWITHVRQWKTANTVADGNGRAVFDLMAGIPVKSIWLAIDISTGAFAASSPPEYPWPTEVRFPVEGLISAKDGIGYDGLEDRHDSLDVLVVRPGLGAWTLTAERSGADGRGVLISFADLQPLGASQSSLTRVMANDVVVAIDPERMEYFAQQLGGNR